MKNTTGIYDIEHDVIVYNFDTYYEAYDRASGRLIQDGEGQYNGIENKQHERA